MWGWRGAVFVMLDRMKCVHKHRIGGRRQDDDSAFRQPLDFGRIEQGLLALVILDAIAGKDLALVYSRVAERPAYPQRRVVVPGAEEDAGSRLGQQELGVLLVIDLA